MKRGSVSMEKEEILKWNSRYDSDYPWWTKKEKELGNKLQKNKELTREDLVQVVKWKFKEMPGRKKRIMGLIAKNSDERIRNVSNQFFSITSNDDSIKVDTLCMLDGVGPALASTILTFINPKDYGVFDIHVWRELFGQESNGLFTTANYLKLLKKLRKTAGKHNLFVRIVEKAHFKKNYDESNKS
jgi:hypothetical protein